MSNISQNTESPLSIAFIDDASKKDGTSKYTDDLMKAKEDLIRLKIEIAKKNRLLESANSVLTSFGHIATDQYKLNLQNLYLRLEFLINGEAQHLSNNSKGNLRKMQAAIQKMKLVTDDIIYISQIYISENVSHQVDLKQIFRIAKKNCNDKVEEYGFRIACDDLPLIPGSPLLLVPLFNHLIDNAIKLRNPSGQGKLTITAERISKYEEDSEAERSYHKISFFDNGMGFMERDKDQIFNILYYINNEAYKRVGINLPAAKKIMDLHNGYITAENRRDGAVFSCFFPV